MKPPTLFEKYLPKIALKATSISHWSVGEHIDHSLNVLITINEGLSKSTPWEKHESFKLLKSIVLFTGFIPRGKGKSPEMVLPSKSIEAEDLIKKIKNAETALVNMNKCDPGCWMIHPVFGALQAKNTRRFMDIHTNHHLKIIEDIIKNVK